MTPQQESKLKKLGPFNLSQAEKIGLSHQNLSRLVKDERILRMIVNPMGASKFFHFGLMVLQ